MSIGDHRSGTIPLEYGVPQGSVLGPLLFIIYTTPLTELIQRHSVLHEMYADDTQMISSRKPEEFSILNASLNNCVREIGAWMRENKLKLNEDKTEAVLFSYKLPSNADAIAELPVSMHMNDVNIQFSDSALDLGFTIDKDLDMKQHILRVRKLAYAQIRQISSIRPFLTEEATKKLVCACILSRLDYCNALLVGLPDSTISMLQLVQNDAARLVVRVRRNHHATEILKKLHWLPIKQRIKFKICCILYNIYAGDAPPYLNDRVARYEPERVLRSATEHKFSKAPRYNREDHGGRTLPVLADKYWNKLPSALRLSPSLQTFKTRLKTHLFDEAFS